jgi:parallel beta-helix repeat protein
MKKKILLLMLLFMFLSTNALSQNTIYGTTSGDVQEGISVELYKPSCGGDALVGTSTTNSEGYYEFVDLDDASYRVVPNNPSYVFNPGFYSVEIPQTIIQPYDFASTSILIAKSFVVAPSDSSDALKAQADYVCDGTADNVVIQAAIDALAAPGGEVKLLPGTYTVGAGIIIREDNITLSGYGYGTYVTASGALGSILHQIYVTGNHVTIRNFHLNGARGIVKYQIVFSGNQYSRVENMTIGSSGTDGIVFGPNSKDGIANNNYLYDHNNPQGLSDLTSSLEVEDGSERIIITNNTVYNSNSGFFPHVHTGNPPVKDIVFSNNLLTKGPDSNSHLTGCGIYIVNAVLDAPLEGLVITNNIIDGGRVQTTGTMNRIASGNIIKNTVSTSQPAVFFATGAEVIFTDNQIHNGAHVGLDTHAVNSIISNNQIHDNHDSGLKLRETSAYNVITSNIIRDNGNYGIDLIGADYASIVNNQLLGNNMPGIRLRVDSIAPVLTGNTITGNGYSQVWNETLDAIIR